MPLGNRILWMWFLHSRYDSWSIYTAKVHIPWSVFPGCDDNNSVIEESRLEWLVNDYYCVGFVQMYPPPPFQCILTSSRKSLAHKWIEQTPSCRLRRVSAPEWNPVEYSMVSPYDPPFGPNKYQSSVAWLSESLQVLSVILPLVSCYRPFSDVGDLHLPRLNILRWLGLSLPCQMWNTGKRDPRTSILLRVKVLQWVLIWGKQWHCISQGTSSLTFQVVHTK